MTKRKNNKRALIVSALSLLLCVSMLVGSTMAWFTDTESVFVNEVHAGTLDIDIVDAEGKSLVGQELSFIDKDEVITWEPGARHVLESVKVVNNGNLWAKCKVALNYADDDATDGVDLGDVIDVYIDGSTEPAGTLSTLSQTAIGNEFSLAPAGKDGSSATYGEIKLVMQTTAGNEYQDKSISGVSITVLATQATAEKDSYDETYDENATYAVVTVNGVEYLTLQEAVDAAKPGDTVTINGDMVCEGVEINKDLTLDLGGYTLTSNTAGEAVLRICAPDANTPINVTINATTGGVVTTADRLPVYAGHIDAAQTNVTINGGDYQSAWGRAIYQNNGVCTINGGTFRADGWTGDTANGEKVYNTLVLDNYDGGEGSFVINGGKFYQFNPACLSINKYEHHNHSAIAAGKTGVLNADGWFEVADGSLCYHIVCEATVPAPAHGHCYASLADAQAALAVNNCNYDKIVKGAYNP